MKKIYLFSVALALTASCSNEVIVDNGAVQETPVAIGFSSVTDQLTRGTTKPSETDYYLEDYHQTFAVYGTKVSQVDSLLSYVFGGDATSAAGIQDGLTCTYDSASTASPNEWTYKPLRYWDTQADYKFIAYAPAAAPIRYSFAKAGNEVGDLANKFVSTAAYTIQGQNLQQGVADSMEIKSGFTGVTPSTDIDIMVSDLQTADGATHKTSDAAVDLVFRHTLAKLNVKLNVETNAPDTLGTAGYRVEVTSVTVNDLLSTGSYDSIAWTVDSIAPLQRVNYSFSADAPGVQLYEDDTYFIESLVMPQDISDDQKITLRYTITSIDEEGNEHTEPYTYRTTLAEVFKIDATTPIATEYNENSNYTVAFHLNPMNNLIKFDAGVYDWANEISNQIDIE